MSNATALILAVAAVLTALGVIGKYLRLDQFVIRLWRLVALSELQASFLQDWNGEAPRKGYEGRLSFPERMAQVESRTMQLTRNTGSHLADSITHTRETVDRLEDGLLDLSQRVTDVNAKAEALGQRQEVLRMADQQFAGELKHFIETRYSDLIAGNEGLRAALNEVLAIDEEAHREQH